MTARQAQNRGGFTLIEVIVALVLGLTLATVMVITTDTLLTSSSDPIFMADTHLELLQEMENITREYRRRLGAGTLDLAAYLAGLDLSAQSIAITLLAVTPIDTSGSYVLSSTVTKVTLSKDNQSVVAYFSQ